jgi:hypothetical protein
MRFLLRFDEIFLLSSLAAAIAVTVTGCGRSHPDRVPVVPVDGTVTFEGKPTPGATIVLHRKDKAPSAVPAPRAQVEKDGTFRFTTYDANDGVPPGEYVATIAWYKLTGQGRDVQPGPNVLPSRYSNPATSKWEVHVAEGPLRLPPTTLRR